MDNKAANPGQVVLPQEIDLSKCISLKTSFKDACVPTSALTRLADAVVRLNGNAICNLDFETDLNGIRLIKGEARIDVTLICQRCSSEYVESLVSTFELTPDLAKAQSLKREDKYDYCELDENSKIDLYTLIEDSLLLEIPTIARHVNEDECLVKGEKWIYGEEVRDNPFAALADLIKK